MLWAGAAASFANLAAAAQDIICVGCLLPHTTARGYPGEAGTANRLSARLSLSLFIASRVSTNWLVLRV